MKELQKKYTPGRNDKHFERLLIETKESRRSWIEKCSGRIEDVIQEYPLLENINMVYLFFFVIFNLNYFMHLTDINIQYISYFQILFECTEVIFSTNVQEVFRNVEHFISRLEKFYFKDTKVTEGRKASVIQKMNDELMKKNKTRTATSMWSIKEVILVNMFIIIFLINNKR